jgi:hypothetical protein
MNNVPMTNATNASKIANLRSQQCQILDHIGQWRIRAQVADCYGLVRISENCRSSIERHEAALLRLSTALAQLGSN